MLQCIAGSSHPGARQVRSRHRTYSASFAEGVYRGSAAAGKANGRNVADSASSATTCAGISSSTPAR